jgi:hypothetical protein
MARIKVEAKLFVRRRANDVFTDAVLGCVKTHNPQHKQRKTPSGRARGKSEATNIPSLIRPLKWSRSANTKTSANNGSVYTSVKSAKKVGCPIKIGITNQA